MHRWISILLFSTFTVAAQNPPVPSEYTDLYSLLNTQISSFDAAVKSGWNGTRSSVLYAPQLQTANSDNYTNLLAAYHYSNQVIPELNHLKALGATAVTVHIDFPILYRPFYSANPSLYQEFLNFYEQLAVDIHSRGLKMCVESIVGQPFAGNDAAAFVSYYKSLSWGAYMVGRGTNAAAVAQLVQPDYMSVVTEPDTEATYAYQPNVDTVSGSTALVKSILSAISAAGVTDVKVGAGAGTWIPNFTSYITSFAATTVNYVDMHIYPINNNDLMAVLSAADTIHAAGKGVSISEAWEYKVRNDELGVLTDTQIYARDPFSFWQPVDAAFLSALADFANYKDLLFISPFWSQYFSAYLDFNTYGALPDTTILNDLFAAAANTLEVGGTTPTSMAWLDRIIPAPDKTPPSVPTNFIAATVYPNDIGLTWTPSTDNVGVNEYKLYRNGSLLATTTLVAYNDLNLVAGETYTYTLQALDASGNASALTAPLVVETTDTTPPTVPTGLTVTSNTSKAVSLKWNASTGIGGVGGYWVLRGSTPTSMTIHATVTTGTTYTDHNQPSTTYYYAVEAFNPLKIASAPSTTVTVTTPAK